MFIFILAYENNHGSHKQYRDILIKTCSPAAHMVKTCSVWEQHSSIETLIGKFSRDLWKWLLMITKNMTLGWVLDKRKYCKVGNLST